MDRADKLDTKELRNLLQLVVAWDPRKPKDGQLAIYNSLRIAVPGPVEQEVRVCVSTCHVHSAEGKVDWQLLYCGQVVIRAHPVQSNAFHSQCRMDTIMFLPPWCPERASDLRLQDAEDFEHVSFGKVIFGYMSKFLSVSGVCDRM